MGSRNLHFNQFLGYSGADKFENPCNNGRFSNLPLISPPSWPCICRPPLLPLLCNKTECRHSSHPFCHHPSFPAECPCQSLAAHIFLDLFKNAFAYSYIARSSHHLQNGVILMHWYRTRFFHVARCQETAPSQCV